MKYLKELKTIAFSILIMLVFSTQAFTQNTDKVDRVGSNFCNSVTSFLTSLETLDKANLSGSMDDFNTAYKKADKAYNKMVKEADKLENVEYNQSVKAYNKLVKSIDNIEGNTKTAGDADQINSNIDATADEIEDILTTVCK